MTELTARDIAWIHSVYPRAETDDVWRRLFGDYKAQAAALERVRAHVRASGGSCQGAMILALAETEGDAP